MQEEEKNLVEEQVEDGEVVELEMPEEEADESAPVEDVSEEEQAKDEDKDELENYSKNVQKRIATLTKKMREQERAAQSAFEYAKSLQEENNQLKTSNSEANQNYYSEAENRLKSQRAQANAVLKSAYQEQDWDKVTKAQEILDKITVEESKLVNTKMKVEEAPQTPVSVQDFQQQYQQPVQQAAPEPEPAAQDWAEKNKWFGEDETMTLAAFNIHRKLIEEEGFDPSDSMYYDEIDKRIRVEFPHKFEDGGEVKPKQKMQQTVAPAVRSEGSGRKRQVRLTKSEVEMARRLNVPVQEYAKHIKR